MTTKPVLVDLFCCQGGATKGYQDAGFYVIGVDNKPQPRYVGDQFCQMDCIEWLYCFGALRKFKDLPVVAIHASPPCQTHSALKHLATPGKHVDLIDPCRDLLREIGLPYIMENVKGAPLETSVILCGSMFRLATPCGAELERHRLFELWGWDMDEFVPNCEHGWSLSGLTVSLSGEKAYNGNYRADKSRRVLTVTGNSLNDNSVMHKKRRTISVQGTHPRDASLDTKASRAERKVITVAGKQAENSATAPSKRRRTISVTDSTAQQNVERNELRETYTVEEARVAMACPWMTMKGLSQAIPPPYAEFLGRQLFRWLRDHGRI